MVLKDYKEIDGIKIFHENVDENHDDYNSKGLDIFLMFSQGKITKEELDKVTAIENDLGTLESKNKENQYIDKGDTKKDVLEQNKEL